MISWKTVVVGYLAAACLYTVVALERHALRGEPPIERALPPSVSLPVPGPNYYLWADNSAGVTFYNLAGGAYRIIASSSAGHWIGGKGWNPGSPRSIVFTSNLGTNDGANLGVYGWTTNPLVEYYVVERYWMYNPSTGGRLLGTFTSDGSTYTVLTSTRVNQPSIQGTTSYTTVWSIRSSRRTSGTVTLANHFNAWRSFGVQLGSHNLQIVATEGNFIALNVTVTVAEGPAVSSTRSTSLSTSVSSTASASSISSDPNVSTTAAGVKIYTLNSGIVRETMGNVRRGGMEWSLLLPKQPMRSGDKVVLAMFSIALVVRGIQPYSILLAKKGSILKT
ncbi:Endo-1,4-beta-xylanase A Short=Xylanase A; AltName: Full=1,4-beta-D-xylan xylanohydrolase A; AltName: Full=22 kDa xylanase; AltName: Full=Xylanase X22; Flags: Precursor [Serendipita indica DSM 11827]|uniref:Endo-1,4-beta-xylanase n=1 Tax=Serendipita indica (strain DSM 11827) TaxID=1109443 RepID=G4U379_SERID|nr:Endo-1,4-beta-xylanase A Short=Xylanase A; AltName: Full=1,4-beta-D-xylan xylanohydrolase A; AltName: Full=22 kDa xylanase; AltName: Full=Xylanase X22; Flags: Precursor [Serendipita indica DSM 11827]CCA78038.1 probable endo-1,4-beta-xylanase A precursor [Serendipita indica DSM 11827]